MMNKIIAVVAVVVGIATTSWATNSHRENAQEAFNIMTELEYIAMMLAGEKSGCGVLYRPNVKLTFDEAQKYYGNLIGNPDVSHEDTVEWMTLNTIDEYSETIDFILQNGCEQFNVFIIDHEDNAVYTGSLFNYYQPNGL